MGRRSGDEAGVGVESVRQRGRAGAGEGRGAVEVAQD